MSSSSFWGNFLSNMGKSPQFSGSLLGAGLGAAGTGLQKHAMNKSAANVQASPLPTGGAPSGPAISVNPLQPSPQGNPGILNPTPAPVISPDAGGGDLLRPTLMAPGNRLQQLDMGPRPTQPGFKFPSMMSA